MPKKKKTIGSRWISKRFLISLEAILLVGLLENIAEDSIATQSWPAAVVTLILMLLVAGAFGFLMSVVMLLTKKSLMHGHKKIEQALPFKVHHILLHLCVLLCIYWLYYRYY